MRVSVLVAIALGAASAFVGGGAHSAEEPPPSPRRVAPDYDGRPASPGDDDQPALWAPRAALAGPWALVEYGLRRPLGLAVSALDHAHIVGGAGGSGFGVLPTFQIDVGRQSTLGALISLDKKPFEANELRVWAGFGGPEWLALRAVDRVHLDVRTTFELTGDVERTADGLYYGLGPRSRDADRALYATERGDVGLSFRYHHRLLDAVVASARLRRLRFDDDPCCASLAERIDGGLLRRPPGFAGYTAVTQGLELVLDSRNGVGKSSSGLRLELEGEHAFDAERPVAARWVRYRSALSLFVDLTGHDRVLGLTVETRFADPLGTAPVPFTELASLGGDGPLRGFLPGRVLDRSVAAATITYAWPIWVFLEGTAHVGVGNGFGPDLADFDPRLLRLSFGGGFRTRGEHDAGFELLFAAGTDPFIDGTAIHTARFVLALTPQFPVPR